MSSGTITLRRPRVRGVEERFESRVLPLFARRTKELGARFPSCICTDWQRETSSWRCGDCWGRGGTAVEVFDSETAGALRLEEGP